MKFFSTRDHSRIVTASQAIAQGLSDEAVCLFRRASRRWMSRRSVRWITPRWLLPSWDSI